MQHVRSVLGYTIAVLSLGVALATFFGNAPFGRTLVARTGLKVSPWMNGGGVVRTIDHGDYETAIHETVFQGLFSERDEGFVQIDWVRKREFPGRITERIDFDNDGTVDFAVAYDVEGRHAEIEPHNPTVIPKVETFPGENRMSVRVRLKNPGGCVRSGGQDLGKSGTR